MNNATATRTVRNKFNVWMRFSWLVLNAFSHMPKAIYQNMHIFKRSFASCYTHTHTHNKANAKHFSYFKNQMQWRRACTFRSFSTWRLAQIHLISRDDFNASQRILREKYVRRIRITWFCNFTIPFWFFGGCFFVSALLPHARTQIFNFRLFTWAVLVLLENWITFDSEYLVALRLSEYPKIKKTWKHFHKTTPHFRFLFFEFSSTTKEQLNII